MKKYSDHTYNSANPIARFAHRQRFLKSVESIPLIHGISILDYGCGDGKLLNCLNEKYIDYNFRLVGYEPHMDLIHDNKVQIYNSLDKINERFDVITCFEVLEHFNCTYQEQMLDAMVSKLKVNGTVIISVPVEIGFPSFIKNIRRVILHYSDEYSLKNIFKSIVALPIPESRNRNGYLSHMGFNHLELEKTLQKKFQITSKRYSPFKSIGYYFNSQVFYELKVRVS